MARRSDHAPEELKELAITKGLEIIDKKGPSGFSARGTAAAMGYTVGALYPLFGGLDGLLTHINARILDDWHAALERGLKKTRQPPLKYLARAYIGFARERRHRWQALFGAREGKAPPPAWYAKKIARLFALVEQALPPSTPNPRQRAKLLWAGLHGICVLSLSGKLDITGPDRPETLVDALLAELA